MDELILFKGILGGTTAILILLAGSFFMFIKFNRDRINSIKETAKRELQFQKELNTAAFEVSEEIKSQISRELHDNIGHTITLALMVFEEMRVKKEINPIKLEELDRLIQLASNDIRSVSRSLNADFLALNDFTKSIEIELNRLRKLHPSNIEFSKGSINESIFTKEQRLFAYRIFQEAMSNAIKHSKAERISVQCLKDDFLLKIEDNGLGFEIEAMPNSEGSNGIINMRKRAELVNLKFNLTSTIGSGTTIQLGLS